MEIQIASEEAIGLLCYSTTPPGIGGRIKDTIEDFVVEEILEGCQTVQVGRGLVPTPQSEGGKYCHFCLEKRGIDLFQAIERVSKAIGVHGRDFSYQGTKDARAITCQLVSVKGVDPDRMPDWGQGRVRIHTPYSATEELRRGGHWGNSFLVKIRGADCSGHQAEDRVREVGSQIVENGGVPNFFGHQRFGTTRSNTHIVGCHMLAGDFESAVREYLCVPYEGERKDALGARMRLMENWDPESALNYFPQRLNYERMMLKHLSLHKNDYLGALRRLPNNLLSLFPRAYQSYLFNLTLSRRLGEEESFLPRDGDVIEKGDLYLAVGEDISPHKATKEMERGVARLVYSVVGYASAARGPLSSDVEETMVREGVTPAFFYSRQLPDLNPGGSYRPLLSPVMGLKVETADNDRVDLSFKLRKGCYATVVLREFMKAGITAY